MQEDLLFEAFGDLEVDEQEADESRRRKEARLTTVTTYPRPIAVDGIAEQQLKRKTITVTSTVAAVTIPELPVKLHPAAGIAVAERLFLLGDYAGSVAAVREWRRTNKVQGANVIDKAGQTLVDHNVDKGSAFACLEACDIEARGLFLLEEKTAALAVLVSCKDFDKNNPTQTTAGFLFFMAEILLQLETANQTKTTVSARYLADAINTLQRYDRIRPRDFKLYALLANAFTRIPFLSVVAALAMRRALFLVRQSIQSYHPQSFLFTRFWQVQLPPIIAFLDERKPLLDAFDANFPGSRAPLVAAFSEKNVPSDSIDWLVENVFVTAGYGMKNVDDDDDDPGTNVANL
ncbi:hypothetical protein HK100_012841 [Physocladia obscura]|uniref:Uncharacterized protein n=1 Tax=Physocladia obscura TaxID=109957 RepID=A0AAD5XFK9_9FUNG|nr:hypothetical protein HK100_012841 [Physocladia obscura]